MDKKRFWIVALCIVGLFVIIALGSSAKRKAQDAIGYTQDQFNSGISMYVDTTAEFAKFQLCVDTEVNTQTSTFRAYDSYLTAEVDRVKYRQYIDQQGTTVESELQNAKNSIPQVTGQNGAQVPDMGRLPEAAMPSAYAATAREGIGGFEVNIKALTEAQVLNIPPSVFDHMADSIQVSNNHINQCGISWLNTAAAYNKWRAQLPGKLVGDLATYLGVPQLPSSMPLYSGNYTGQGGIPTAQP